MPITEHEILVFYLLIQKKKNILVKKISRYSIKIIEFVEYFDMLNFQ